MYSLNEFIYKRIRLLISQDPIVDSFYSFLRCRRLDLDADIDRAEVTSDALRSLAIGQRVPDALALIRHPHVLALLVEVHMHPTQLKGVVGGNVTVRTGPAKLLAIAAACSVHEQRVSWCAGDGVDFDDRGRYLCLGGKIAVLQ